MSSTVKCPAWCDGTHPGVGGVGNTAHTRSHNGVELEWVTNPDSWPRDMRVKWAGPTIMSNYCGAEGLRLLAADALALADEIEKARR